MPKVSVKRFQRRIAELDARYPVAQPKRARSFRGVVALVVVALVAMAVLASIHNAPSKFARLTLKQGTATPKSQPSDAEAQAKWTAIWGAVTTGVKQGE